VSAFSTGSPTTGLPDSPRNPVVVKNADGLIDVYVGPAALQGLENNWVQTVPGKGWNFILRLYGPLEPFLDKT